MTESELLELFRRALRASLAVPLLAGVASCSSSSAETPDASGKRKDAASDSGRDALQDAGHDARQDAGHDAGHDAGRDAGHDVGVDAPPACQPASNECVTVTCFDGGVSAAACTASCPTTYFEPTCSVVRHDSGVAAAECFNGTMACNGRAYAGMERPTTPGQRSPLGRYFAETAQLEAAAVDAFRILRDELRAHDAPGELVALAEAAARDEVRHARVTRRLARRYGPCTPHRGAPARPVRELVAVAEENAVEGCVRETYAALLAHHQAMASVDGEVREAMTRIATDETRHAALAWKVAAWAEARLDDGGRARVADARARAARELRSEVRESVPAPLTEVAGLPVADAATRMVAVLYDALWAR